MQLHELFGSFRLWSPCSDLDSAVVSYTAVNLFWTAASWKESVQEIIYWSLRVLYKFCVFKIIFWLQNIGLIVISQIETL